MSDSAKLALLRDRFMISAKLNCNPKYEKFDEYISCTFEVIREYAKDIMEYLNIPFLEDKSDGEMVTIALQGATLADLMGRIEFPKDRLNQLLFNAHTPSIPRCRLLMDEDAVFPSKQHVSDVGYDLTIIRTYKQLSKKTSLYDTGIKLHIEFGYYVEIVPRSSISKSGYIMSNSIGIIDNTYRGNLLIALTKIDDELPDLQLPFRCAQLIVRKQHYTEFELCNENEFTGSDRGEGGFGSTNEL